MNHSHSNSVSELDAAEQLEVHPIIILGWRHKGWLVGEADEIGYNFTPDEISRFEQDHPGNLKGAQLATRLCAKIEVARKALLDG